jgi:hypothetical protein
VPVLRHTNKNVQFSVQTAAIKRVPDPSKHKCVKDKRLNNRILVFLLLGVVNMMIPKDIRAQEVENKDNGDQSTSIAR